MSERPDERAHLPSVGLVLGLVSGLIEGGLHLLRQRLDILDNSWYSIIWIAAVFNGLLVGAAGVLAGVVVARRPATRRLYVGMAFSLWFLALVPVLALMLEEWLYRYAILLLTLGASTAGTRWYFSHEAWVRRATRPAVGVALAASLIAFVGIEGGTSIQERVATARLPTATASAPNVLLIIVDTLRSDHLSSYGYGRRTSPAIDRLAAQGVLFENSFSTSSYTLPSHESILTGRYPRDHQVEWDTDYRRPEHPVPILPQVLQSYGYRTGAFSANTLFFTREHGFGRGYLHFEDFFHSLADMAGRTAYGTIGKLAGLRLGFQNLPARKLATDVTSAADRWISRDTDRPFFVTMNFMDVHDPYLPPEPYLSLFATAPRPKALVDFRRLERPLTAAQLQGEVDAYDGAIAYVDAQISRLLSLIQARSLTRELLVVVTSDHGEEFGEHGGFNHAKHLYREVIQVPLVLWQPGRVPAGTRVNQPVSNAAIAATVLTLLDADPAPFVVPSLQPLWEGTRSDFAPPVAALKRSPRRGRINQGSMRSVVDGAWHYIEQDGRGFELFDWIADPRERTDLATTPPAPAISHRLRTHLK